MSGCTGVESLGFSFRLSGSSKYSIYLSNVGLLALAIQICRALQIVDMESKIKSLEYSLKAGAFEEVSRLATKLEEEGEDLRLQFSLPSKTDLETQMPWLRQVEPDGIELPRVGQISTDQSSRLGPKTLYSHSKPSSKAMPFYSVQIGRKAARDS